MRAIAPGRVNLIGDHTDYTGGLVFPMAINRHTVIDARFTDDSFVSLKSADEPDTAHFNLPVSDFSSLQPRWARYIAAVAAESKATRGFDGSRQELAQLAQRAEHAATGVPTGIMDQLCIASAQENHAMLIDCSTLEIVHSPIPQECKIVVQFIAHRTLQGSEYANRVHQCNAAESIIGPLRLANINMLELIKDDTISKRARHVISENLRVREFAQALASHELQHAGKLMNEGHRSLALDFDTSTPTMDKAVEEIQNLPGVYGARMTGGGFGGCVVALCSRDADVPGWTVSAVGAARLV